MIIELHGEISVEKLSEVLMEIITDMNTRVGLNADINFNLKDVKVGVVFNVNGEKMGLVVEHEGIKEAFTVHVELDEAGNIKRAKDNEEETFLDEYSRAISKGLESPTTEEIESVFNDEDLEEVFTETGGDLKAVHYKHKIQEGLFVVRYFRNEILVGETGYGKKEA